MHLATGLVILSLDPQRRSSKPQWWQCRIAKELYTRPDKEGGREGENGEGSGFQEDSSPCCEVSNWKSAERVDDLAKPNGKVPLFPPLLDLERFTRQSNRTVT